MGSGGFQGCFRYQHWQIYKIYTLISKQFKSHDCWVAKVRESDWQRVWRGSKGRVDFGTVRRKGRLFQGEEIVRAKQEF